MPFLTWTKEYEFGIPEIDSQHKHWLEMLNDFYDHLEGNNLKDHLISLLDEVIDYTHYHFFEEEKLMASIHYPAKEEQQKLHKDIADKILEYRKRIVEDKPIVSMTITNELKSWFKNHILVEDRKYAELYNALKQSEKSSARLETHSN